MDTLRRRPSQRQNPCAKPRLHGFTLIELLVVIAIISILASMLFPAFSRARESARKAVCISNTKQIGLGIMQYTQDYDEMYPLGYPFWAVSLSPTLPKDRLLVHVVNPYIKLTQVWSCPSWKGRYTANPDYLGNYGFVTGECANNNVIGSPLITDSTQVALQPASLAALNTPSEHPMLFCGVAWQQVGTKEPLAPSESFCDAPVEKLQEPLINAHSGVTDGEWVYKGANGGTTILYGDGHAKYFVGGKGKWDELYKRPR